MDFVDKEKLIIIKFMDFAVADKEKAVIAAFMELVRLAKYIVEAIVDYFNAFANKGKHSPVRLINFILCFTGLYLLVL